MINYEVNIYIYTYVKLGVFTVMGNSWWDKASVNMGIWV